MIIIILIFNRADRKFRRDSFIDHNSLTVMYLASSDARKRPISATFQDRPFSCGVPRTILWWVPKVLPLIQYSGPEFSCDPSEFENGPQLSTPTEKSSFFLQIEGSVDSLENVTDWIVGVVVEDRYRR
ncbi:MAG: hypothetical protein H6Q43_2018 [Deltaproteobacteria bacterium]|nr:hypothetical protein [Deltaproteobacteria bacterium]